MSPLLKVQNLGLRYRSQQDEITALTEISFDLAAGDRLAIIGESGSGKSSLALALGGLLPASATTAGAISWPGFAEPPRNGRDIGFVFQDPSGSLDPLMRVGCQIVEVLRAHLDLDHAAATTRSAQLLARVGLPAGSASAYPFQLSGGQRQRVAIACAIAAGPRLLIADEATSALDTITQARITSMIAELVHADGMALIFITHDIALASQIADRIAVFHDGHLVEQGLAADIIANPRHAYVRRLIKAHIGLSTPPLLDVANG